MSLTIDLKKAARVVRLSLKREMAVGNCKFRTKGFFINDLALENGSPPHEPWLDVIYRTLLICKEGAFVDVGANTGQTMLKILALDRTRAYVGFEPQISCCFLIERFIEANSLESHVILPMGLSNKNQLVKLRMRGREYARTASIIDHFRPRNFYRSQRHICVRRGDEVIAELNIGPVSVIKIDAEGAELEVIEGFSRTIQEGRPFITFEVLNHFLVTTAEPLDIETIRFREGRTEQIESILAAHSYETFRIFPDNLIERVGKIRPSTSADLTNTNYMAVSKADVPAFVRAFPGNIQ